MRLDKFLKVARIIKRRTVANSISSKGRVMVNDKVAKPSVNLKVGDIIEIAFGSGNVRVEVLALRDNVRKDEVSSLYRILGERKEETFAIDDQGELAKADSDDSEEA